MKNIFLASMTDRENRGRGKGTRTGATKTAFSPLTVVLLIVLILYALTLIGLLFWAVITSFKSQAEFRINILGFPDKWVWNYGEVFRSFQVSVMAEDGKGPAGRIVFDHVSFSYAGRAHDVEDISFTVPAGGSLGIIGPTGSGKSTIIRLMLRLYDADSGRIYIDGRDVRSIPGPELYAMFGTAMQQDFLYADTVEENIRFGREIGRESMEEAARIAQADGFIRSFADGYGHELAQKGANLSGGQKQRLLISRALAGRPEILVLDDSSSALDYRTDAALRRALASERGECTVVTVAQRVSSVKNCDCILVLEEGRIIGSGRHEELLESCAAYREISESQMGGAIVD